MFKFTVNFWKKILYKKNKRDFECVCVFLGRCFLRLILFHSSLHFVLFLSRNYYFCYCHPTLLLINRKLWKVNISLITTKWYDVLLQQIFLFNTFKLHFDYYIIVSFFNYRISSASFVGQGTY